nr:MAG TPA: hypothetical protein [Bacteriophage sp.]
MEKSAVLILTFKNKCSIMYCMGGSVVWNIRTK